MVHITTKVCAKCKEEKSIDDFYFLNNKGCYDCYCKKCHVKMSSDWQRKNPEKYYELIKKSIEKKKNKCYASVGGWKMSVLNHAKKNEYKYTALNTDGQLFQTNNKEDFINFINENV